MLKQAKAAPKLRLPGQINPGTFCSFYRILKSR